MTNLYVEIPTSQLSTAQSWLICYKLKFQNKVGQYKPIPVCFWHILPFLNSRDWLKKSEIQIFNFGVQTKINKEKLSWGF